MIFYILYDKIIKTQEIISEIREQIDSILAQESVDVTIHIFDDCSKDSTQEIAKEYEKKDKRVVVIDNKENRGVSSVRNDGIDKADTEYICFVDSDDRVEKNYVETLLSLFDKNTAFTSCSYKYEKRNNKYFKNKKEKIKTFTKWEALKEVVSDKTFFGFTWNKMYKKSILKDVRYNKEVHAGEDLVFNIDYIDNCPDKSTVKFTTKKLYHYTKTKGSASGMSCSETKFYRQKTLFDALEKIKNTNGHNKDKEFCSRINSWYFLMSLQFTVYAHNLKLKEEKKFFKQKSKEYFKDYKKNIKAYSTFRKCGILLYYLIKIFM